MVSSKVEVRGRVPGPLRLAFTRAIQEWYYWLIPLGAMNVVWLALVLTVVAGPPATAAMMRLARDAATGYGVDPGNFFIYLRRFFWRAWGLGIVTLVGTIVLVTDIFYYAAALRGNSFLLNLGIMFLVYLLVVWAGLLLIAWPMLVDQPQMAIRDVVRNAAILTLRVPGATFGLVLVVLLVFLFSAAFAVLIFAGFAAFVSLVAQHYLHIQAPILADFEVLGEDTEGAGVSPGSSQWTIDDTRPNSR